MKKKKNNNYISPTERRYRSKTTEADTSVYLAKINFS